MRTTVVRLLGTLALVPLVGACAVPVNDSGVTSDAPSLPTSLDVPGPTNLQTDAATGAIPARDKSFGLTPPSGWKNDTATQPSTVLFLKSATAAGSIFPTFTVIRTTPRTLPPLSELVEQGMIAQRQNGSTVTKLADRSIGGVPAGGYSMTRTQDKIPITQTQYYAVQGTSVYVTTMTSATSDKASSSTVQDAILNSWSWGAPPAPTATTSTPATSAPSATPTKK